MSDETQPEKATTTVQTADWLVMLDATDDEGNMLVVTVRGVFAVAGVDTNPDSQAMTFTGPHGEIAVFPSGKVIGAQRLDRG